MPSVTLLFPGQGAQYVGMYQKLSKTRVSSLFDEANDILGYNLLQLMKEGPAERLTETSNSQPAILFYSIVLFKQLKLFLEEKQITIDRVLGHSLGEYSALVAAETLNWQDGLRTVHMRGKLMQEMTTPNQGGMIALLKVPEDKVLQACQEASQLDSLVNLANFNCPGQMVISGDKTACQRAVKWLENNYDGHFQSKELNVSGPFHSPYMEPAAQQLEKVMSSMPFLPNQIPYVADVDAEEYPIWTEPAIIKRNLVAQMSKGILWEHSIKKLPSDTVCLEVGPGKVLTGLVKRINPQIRVMSLDGQDSFALLPEFFQ